jgi:hypothetical protein
MENNSPTYVVLAESNGKHYETWYTFIKYEGNEKSLENLQSQLKKVEFYIIDDLSTFDLDLDNKVSAETARQMIRIEVNSVMPHRKFDGTLKNIDLGCRSKYSNDKNIVKAFDILGIGRIEQFIDGEDVIDISGEEEGAGGSSSSDYESSDEDTEYEYSISDSSEDETPPVREEKVSRKEQQRQKLVEKLKRMKGLGKKQ